MDTKTTYYRTIKIITHKCKNGGYESYMFRKGDLQSFTSCKRNLQREAIQFAETMIDGQIEDGYLSESADG